MASFALIHSPLTGPSVWFPAAAELEKLGHRTVVPELADPGGGGRPFWKRHAASAAQAIDRSAGEAACWLVAHSGAGALLPAVQARMVKPVAGRIFVDAGLPGAGKSRLEMMASESAAWVEKLERYLISGGRFPEWGDSELRELIPDADLRRRTLAGLRPRTLDFFTEPIPGEKRLAAVPSGYIQFSAAYDAPAARAEALGWPVMRLEAGHFHMLVRPAQVAALLATMQAQLAG